MFIKKLLSFMAILVIILTCLLIIIGLSFTIYFRTNFDKEIDITFFDSIVNKGTTKFYCYDMDERSNQRGELVELSNESLDSENCIYVSLSSVPKDLTNAFIAIEDKRFWNHYGVDWKRTISATINYIFNSDYRFGGSTITQQLIKNVTGENQYSIERKIQEMIWALDLEKKLDKTEILEFYLNIINLSQGCTGVASAANVYFSKDVSELSLLECVSLAAITNNPSYYDPIKHPEHNTERRNIILKQMLSQNLITEEQFIQCYNAILELNTNIATKAKKINSWYIDMVIEDVINDLCIQYGYTKSAASVVVYSGGLRIYTAMDKNIQNVLENYYKDLSKFPSGTEQNPFQSSIIVIHPETGDILGVVGAIGEKNANRIQNYATTTKRPSGSVIKPLSVFAPALDNGIINSASVYDDVPVDFYYQNGKYVAWPANSPAVYKGLTNITTAIKDSVNTVAVRVLDKLGTENSFSFLYNDLNMLSLIETKELEDGSIISDKGIASLALGQQNYGVTVRELTAAYTILANKGLFSDSRSYYKVTDALGNIILDCPVQNNIVIKEETASIMTLMLEEVIKKGTATAITIDKKIAVAGKTGTTQNNCDKWFVGYTPFLLAGVWCGYDYPQSMDNITGNPCIEIWDRIMSELHSEYFQKKYENFALSNNLIKVKVCSDSGLLPTNACKIDARGDRSIYCWFEKGKQPSSYCKCHVEVDYDIVNGGVFFGDFKDESIQKVGMITVSRYFPTQIYISDAQYVWKKIPANIQPIDDHSLPFFNGMLKAGEYCGISKSPIQFNRGVIDSYIPWRDEIYY